MTVSNRTLDTITTIVEQSEGVRLARQLGQQRDDWKQRAEAAEALLRAFVDYACVMEDEYARATCSVCYGSWSEGKKEHHFASCPIARARALLAVHDV